MSEDFFIEDLASSSEDEDVDTYQTRKRTARSYREDSPPAILAFSITSGRDQSPDPSPSEALDPDEGDQGEGSDESVEEWMILDEEEYEGDSNIQLNLSYSADKTTVADEKVTSLQDLWAVSKKDKEFGEMSSICRYYMPGHSLICPICKRTGHQAKNCQNVQKKPPACVCCGIRGHLQKDCPNRPCLRCGLPLHGLRDCNRPPVWNQHCHRCGMTGHLSDTCPDTWRQYHYTISMEVPLRLRTIQAFKWKKRPAFCYNCAKRGHYGHECSRKRTVSGTFPSLPYVCHYDIAEDAFQRTQNKNTELMSGAQPFPERQHFSEPVIGKEDRLLQRRNKKRQGVHGQASSRKTWPEQRRERQEVKRLRREAHAKREGGPLGQCRHKPDDESSYSEPFGANYQWQFTCPSGKITKKVAGVQRCRKDRETERWKKRGGKKHGFLYPHKGTDIGSENLSLKQRMRHRRR